MKLRHWVQNSLRQFTSQSAGSVTISPIVPTYGIWAGEQAGEAERVGVLTYVSEEHVLSVARFCAPRCAPILWVVGGHEWRIDEARFARLVAELSKYVANIHIDARWLDRSHPTFEARLKRFGIVTRRENSLVESDSRSAA